MESDSMFEPRDDERGCSAAEPGPSAQVEPPFDPRWLDRVAQTLAQAGDVDATPQDLFLERRLTLEVSSITGMLRVSEWRSEGAALRWRFPNQVVLTSCNGISPLSLRQLLSRCASQVELDLTRPGPVRDIDPPRGWRDWARELLSQYDEPCKLALVSKHAAVIRPGQWVAVKTPSLFRLHHAGKGAGALLCVWPHPELATWLGKLVAPGPAKQWHPPSGSRLPVVFSEGTAGVLVHELVGHLAEVDLAGGSAWERQHTLGRQVTAATLTVNDDPTRFDLPGAFSHDDEGVPARPITLVKDGRATGLLCDRTGAQRVGGTPGRGRRPVWNRPPAPRLSNLVVTGGAVSPREIERDLKLGLVVTRVAGASIDPVSQRVVLHVERGWEVRRGKRKRGLARLELTGSVSEVLSNIDPNLGDDPTPEWRLGWCLKHGYSLPTGSLAPTILVRDLEVL